MIMSGKDIIQEMERQEKKIQTKEGVDGVSFIDGVITLDGWYWIEIERLKTKDALLGWTVHLLDKKWITVKQLRWIAKIASGVHGYNAYEGM